MCGRFNATFDSGVKKIYSQLNIHKVIDKPIDKRFVKAADTVSIVRNKASQRRVENASWWLLLTPTETSFKPSKYTSFNTRYDKLTVQGSAGYQAFKSSRCIIVVKGFGETEFINKKPIHYYDMQAQQGGLLLGGLCREWQHQQTGKIQTSCSVITLPPHPKLQHIHSKAMPLILPQENSVIDTWLDPYCQDTEQLMPLLRPNIPQNLIAQQIDKPASYTGVNEPLLISQD